MLEHQFNHWQQLNPYSNIVYRKCTKCGKIMFGDDPFFNMVCQPEVTKRENIRKALEMKERNV